MKESWKFNADKHLENLKKIDTEMWKLKWLVDEYNEIITKWNKDIIPRVRLYSVTSGWWVFDGEWEVVLISSSYWFIKWLVENDKISNDWIKPRTDLVKEITIVDYKTGDAIWWKNKYTEVEQLIMYLSIQDEPIRFLCEILK